MEELNPSVCNLGILTTFDEASIQLLSQSYDAFHSITNSLLDGNDLSSSLPNLARHVHALSEFGLRSLLRDHFLIALEERFEKKAVANFWRHFDGYRDVAFSGRSKTPVVNEKDVERVLCKALEEITLVKQYQEKCLLILVDAFESCKEQSSVEGKIDLLNERAYLFSKYQLMVSSVLMASLPRHFPDVLHLYFKGRLEELSLIVDGVFDGEEECMDGDEMDLDESGRVLNKAREMDVNEGGCYLGRLTGNNNLVKNIGKVVRDLRSLRLVSMTENAYASAIFLLLKAKVHELAGEDYRASVLESIKGWIQAVLLQFLQALFAYLGDSVDSSSPSPGLKSPLACQHLSCAPGTDFPSEGLIRWRLRLEYFAYETLQDLRIAKLFEIIVDYPESSPAIEDLKQCLEYTGQHSKLVESFISSLKYRLLTAGASTNDILHQYVSTIKALRTIDPAGIFLEAVGEPIRDYLRGRKDTIKCIVTMLTDGNGGNNNGSGITGDSLLEELNRDEEGQENAGDDDDDFHSDDKQAWINAARWEPDPVEADPLKGSRNQRKVDILGMIVSIIGSKDQLVNEYRVMLAEKLLNKSDYDIDSEIRILELLKIHFGESSMQRCEIMLNDMIDSKRTNHNIKATIRPSQTGCLDSKRTNHNIKATIRPSQTGLKQLEMGVSLDNVNATIISSNFWPPIQDDALNLPEPVEQLLSDYAKRFHEIKTPRKLLWKKNLGAVKLELQFEDRAVQFTVTPLHATIITQFQDQTRWSFSKLASAVGVPLDVLSRRISFWISKGIIVESNGSDSNDRVFTLVEGMGNATKNGSSENYEELLAGDDEGDRSVASVEDQICKEMTVYEKFIMGMLTNFGSMALDRIHNTLKMFCVADPPYDKSLQQLQSFLSGLVSEEKIELRDGFYILKK